MRILPTDQFFLCSCQMHNPQYNVTWSDVNVHCSVRVKKRVLRRAPLTIEMEMIIRIKSGEPGFPGFSVPGRLGGVICKPERAT